MRALGYVSIVAGQARANEPLLDHQAELIRTACERRGWPVLEVIREVEFGSGAFGRPALEYALGRLEEGEATRLVVAQLARLCRSIADLGVILDQVHARGARLLCVDPEIDTGSEAGRTVVRALVAVGDQERERMAQRTREGLMAARSRRAQLRPAVEDRPELRQHILALREQGMTMQAIADRLNEEGVPTLRGGTRWRPSSVHTTIGYKRRGRGAAQRES